MKTVMQMVFEKFDRMPEDVFLTYLKVNREGILEMEKEQLKDMYLRGIENYDPPFKRKSQSVNKNQ